LHKFIFKTFIIKSGELQMEIPKRDGDGYLESMDDWTPEIAKAMAEADNYELNDEKWTQIDRKSVV